MKFYRENVNVSLTELSQITGLSERHLRFIESGDRNPSLPVAKKIADCLGESVDKIFLSQKSTIST